MPATDIRYMDDSCCGDHRALLREYEAKYVTDTASLATLSTFSLRERAIVVFSEAALFFMQEIKLASTEPDYDTRVCVLMKILTALSARMHHTLDEDSINMVTYVIAEHCE